ncbi:MAG: Transcriptional regulatory protein DegU [Syntrophorhabdaceae bacterium PtaU1.Bin034]|nr:MAG: Transcriptional regulatory protein DegU [Syntrophorhabdaceae bacterium PtaU1.Bin034]
MGIRIILADDHKIMREGLKALLEKQQDIEVVAEADNGLEVIRLTKKIKPDIVIMDIGMPELNGIEATRQIAADVPGVRVIALSMHSDKRFVIEMLKVGASGYLLKDSASEELTSAIRAVAANKPYLSPKITDVVIKDYLSTLSKTEPSAFTVLTAREREVLQLLSEGKTTKQIAFALNVSVKTIETHRQQMMEKLNLRSIAELTKYAIREGLTSLEP